MLTHTQLTSFSIGLCCKIWQSRLAKTLLTFLSTKCRNKYEWTESASSLLLLLLLLLLLQRIIISMIF